MSRYKAVIALYPGPFDAPYCTIWVLGRLGEAVAGPTDTGISTADPDRESKVAGDAEAILSEAGYERAGEWESVGWSLQAPVRRQG